MVSNTSGGIWEYMKVWWSHLLRRTRIGSLISTSHRHSMHRHVAGLPILPENMCLLWMSINSRMIVRLYPLVTLWSYEVCFCFLISYLLNIYWLASFQCRYCHSMLWIMLMQETSILLSLVFVGIVTFGSWVCIMGFNVLLSHGSNS